MVDPLIDSAVCDITEAAIGSISIRAISLLTAFVGQNLQLQQSRGTLGSFGGPDYACTRIFRSLHKFTIATSHSTAHYLRRVVDLHTPIAPEEAVEGRLLAVSGQLLDIISEEVLLWTHQAPVNKSVCDIKAHHPNMAQIGSLDSHLRCTIRKILVDRNSFELTSPIPAKALSIVQDIVQEVFHLFPANKANALTVFSFVR